MTERHLVSICIPMYNAAAYIEATMAGVLAQTYAELEVIVVDNASTDGSFELVSAIDDPRVRLLRNDTNLGHARNWNRAVGEARGRYVKLLCADDLLYETAVERQVGALEAHPDAALVSARRDIVDSGGNVLFRGRGPRRTGEVGRTEALRMTVRSGSNPFGEPAAVLMRAAAREKAGDFDGRRPWTIDVDFWCRLLEFGSAVFQPDTLCAFRVTTASWSYELARTQSRQSRAMFEELRMRHPDAVDASDVAVGSARARAMAVGRRAVYAFVRLRNRA